MSIIESASKSGIYRKDGSPVQVVNSARMTEQKVRISVIIPAWNAEKVLPRCLDAINASSHHPHELIVVDDRSTDRTAEIARGRAGTVLQTQAQSGPGAARNLGARASSGDVLLFV